VGREGKDYVGLGPLVACENAWMDHIVCLAVISLCFSGPAGLTLQALEYVASPTPGVQFSLVSYRATGPTMIDNAIPTSISYLSYAINQASGIALLALTGGSNQVYY
jgi:hypothetical protein